LMVCIVLPAANDYVLRIMYFLQSKHNNPK